MIGEQLEHTVESELVPYRRGISLREVVKGMLARFLPGSLLTILGAGAFFGVNISADVLTAVGGLFLGESSPEVLGDYTAGPSHVMPTGGSARFASALSVLDFLKVTSTISMQPEDLDLLGPYAADLARAEGLTGHARSIELRLEGR